MTSPIRALIAELLEVDSGLDSIDLAETMYERGRQQGRKEANTLVVTLEVYADPAMWDKDHVIWHEPGFPDRGYRAQKALDRWKSSS
jgi:hypothetical protein